MDHRTQRLLRHEFLGQQRIQVDVADDVAAEQRDAVRVVVKVRWVPFDTHTHGRPLPGPTRDPAALADAAVAVLFGAACVCFGIFPSVMFTFAAHAGRALGLT